MTPPRPPDYKVQAAVAVVYTWPAVQERHSKTYDFPQPAALLSGGKTPHDRSQELAITYLSHTTTLL